MSAGGPMGDRELEALRRHGFGVAYRMLGSVSEAEDVAQEALLRLTRQEGPIDEPAAWMTTVVTRLSINVLRSARARRESYVGPWLPEPLLEDPAPGPASRAELADSLSLALLVLLERLTPVERAAYLLREVFGYEYAEIAGIIEQTEVNSRQLVTRARKHLEASRPRFDPDEAARDALLERFLAAAEEGDLEALEELLAKDAVLYADSGGKAMAPQEPLFGAALIARFMAAVAQVRPASGEFESRRVRVNGQPGRLVRGPAEPPLGEAERLAAEKALALLKSGDVDAGAARRAREGRPRGRRRRTLGRARAAARGPGLERAHGGCRRGPDPGRAHRAQPGQARPSLSCHRAAGCAVRPASSRTRPRRILMSPVAAQPFSGTYRAQPAPSTFAFAVRHSGVFWYRGSLSDVAATLRADGDALALEGSARVDSISVVEPAAMRASVLGPEFFDAERHPEITFRSTAVRLADDGRAEVDGELTIRGVTRPVTASGHYAPPRASQLRRDRGTAAPDDLRPPRVRLRLADGAAGRWRRGRLGGRGGHRSAAHARGRGC